jgi:hypothetical protein
MLFIKLYYYIFSAFVYALAGLCKALQRTGKLKWKTIPEAAGTG